MVDDVSIGVVVGALSLAVVGGAGCYFCSFSFLQHGGGGAVFIQSFDVGLAGCFSFFRVAAATAAYGEQMPFEYNENSY